MYTRPPSTCFAALRGLLSPALSTTVRLGLCLFTFVLVLSTSSDVRAESRPEPVDVLLFTTTRLETNVGFDAAVQDYLTILPETEGLVAEYVVIDSDECFSRFGVKVTNPSSWTEIRYVLGQISSVAGARYFMILGGKRVVPRPFADVTGGGGTPEFIVSDAWYVDFDNDCIVDDGYSIARYSDLRFACDAVTEGLQTAVALHIAGGITLDREVRFSMNGYTTPPYGVCGACTKQSEFFALISNSDYVIFTGHGTPTGFSTNDYEAIFSIMFMDSIELQTFHPVVIGYFSCNTGRLEMDNPTLSYEFPRAGASAFVARTTDEGVPAHVANNFPPAVMAGERIGDALFRTMRETIFIWGDSFKAAAGHLVLYGDPTLLRRIPPPTDFAGAYTTSTDELLLRWGRSPAVDLSHYAIHRDVGPDFIPSESNRIAEPMDTLVTLSGVPPLDPWYLKITAVNEHGNTSEYVDLAPVDITVPTLVTNFGARWRGDCAEVTWTLCADTPDLEFEVARRDVSDEGFETLSGPVFKEGNDFYFRDENVNAGSHYVYLVRIIESDDMIASFTTDLSIPTNEFQLHDNHPNPFNPSTTIPFTLPEKTPVILAIYDTAGRLVRVLFDDTLSGGLKEVTWNGTDASGRRVSSGVYFYRLAAGREALTKKMVLLK